MILALLDFVSGRDSLNIAAPNVALFAVNLKHAEDLSARQFRMTAKAAIATEHTLPRWRERLANVEIEKRQPNDSVFSGEIDSADCRSRLFFCSHATPTFLAALSQTATTFACAFSET